MSLQQQQLTQNKTSQSNSHKVSYKAESAAAPGTAAQSSWTHLTRSSKLDIRSMTLTGKEGLRGLVLAIATMFSVPNPRYHISNSRSIKDRLVPYDESDEEFLLRFHEMNFNKSNTLYALFSLQPKPRRSSKQS